jgi:hypothetical protein
LAIAVAATAALATAVTALACAINDNQVVAIVQIIMGRLRERI